MRMHVLLVVVAMLASISFALVATLTPPRALALVADFDEHNFGTIEPQVLKHSFRLTNHTDHVISLDHVISGCGCVSVDLPAKQLAPNESTNATCQVDFRGRRGSVSTRFQVVYLELGAMGQKRVMSCSLRATVNAIVSIDPPEVKFSLGHTETRRIQLSSTQAAVRLKSVTCSHPAIRSTILENGLAFDLTFDAAQWRDREDKVAIDIENTCESERFVRIPAYILKLGTM